MRRKIIEDRYIDDLVVFKNIDIFKNLINIEIYDRIKIIKICRQRLFNRETILGLNRFSISRLTSSLITMKKNVSINKIQLICKMVKIAV